MTKATPLDRQLFESVPFQTRVTAKYDLGDDAVFELRLTPEGLEWRREDWKKPLTLPWNLVFAYMEAAMDTDRAMETVRRMMRPARKRGK